MATEATNETNNEEPPPPPYKPTKINAADKTDDKRRAESTVSSTGGASPRATISLSEGLFAQPRNRALAMAVAILFYSIFTLVLYAYNLDQLGDALDACDGMETAYCDWVETQAAGYALLIIGLIFLIITSILAIVWAFMSNKCIALIILILAALGTFFCGIGYFCTITELDGLDTTTNTDAEDAGNAQNAANFSELAIVCITAIILGIDAKFDAFLNDNTKRSLLMSSALFILFGFISGVSYGIVSDSFQAITGIVSDSDLGGPNSEYGCIAAGYFLLAIFTMIRILIIEFGLIIKLGSTNKMIVGLVIASLLLLSGFICAVGYWSVISWWNDLFDLAQQFGGNDEGRDELNCFLIAPSFFILIMSIVNALDMGIIEQIRLMAGY